MHYKTAKANDASQKDQRKSLRNNMTPAEATLWRALKRRGAGGLKFRRQQGIRVVRFRNDQVFTCLSGVVEEIVKAAGEITDPTPTPPLQGRGVPTVTPPRKCRVQEGSAYGHPAP